jgi:hypothetical protein
MLGFAWQNACAILAQSQLSFQTTISPGTNNMLLALSAKFIYNSDIT